MTQRAISGAIVMLALLTIAIAENFRTAALFTTAAMVGLAVIALIVGRRV